MVSDKSIAEQFTNLLQEIESKIKADGLKRKQEQQWIEKKKSIFKEKLTSLLKKEKINPDIFSLSIEDKETVESEIEEIQKSVMKPRETMQGTMQGNPINQFGLTGPIRAWILLYLYYTKVYKTYLPRFGYFPFGGGIRGCIGESFAWMEGIFVIATLTRKWEMRKVPTQRVKLDPAITLRPKHGMKMKLKFRN